MGFDRNKAFNFRLNHSTWYRNNLHWQPRFRLRGLVPESFGSPTDRQGFPNTHSDLLVWKFWNSPIHFCPPRGFSISSIPLYLLNKHQLEIPQVKLTLEAKNGVFSYSVRAIQNWEEKLLTFTCTSFESPTFSPSSSTFARRCRCEMTKMPWSGQSPFQPPIPWDFTSPVIICQARGLSESLQLPGSKEQQDMQREWQVSRECCQHKGRTGWPARCTSLSVPYWQHEEQFTSQSSSGIPEWQHRVQTRHLGFERCQQIALAVIFISALLQGCGPSDKQQRIPEWFGFRNMVKFQFNIYTIIWI